MNKGVLTIAILVLALGFGTVPVAAEEEPLYNDTVEAVDNEGEFAHEVLRDVSPWFLVRDIEWEGNRVVIIGEATMEHSVTVSVPTGGTSFRSYDYNVHEGLNRITVDHDTDEFSIVSRTYGETFSRTGDGFLTRVLSGATGEHLDVSALGGGAGAIIAIGLWVTRKRHKMDTRFFELCFEQTHKVGHYQSLTERATDKLKNKYVMGALAVGIGLTIYYDFSLTDIPIEAWVMSTAATGVGALSYFIVPSINRKLEFWKPSENLIAELDASMMDEDGNVMGKVPVRVWAASPGLTESVDIEGEVRKIESMGKTMHVVNEFHPDEMRAVAADVMSVPEEQLMGYVSAVHENRARTNVSRRFGIKVAGRINRVVDRLATTHHLGLQEKDRELGQYRGDDVTDIIRDEIPEYDMVMAGKPITDEYSELVKESSQNSDSVDSAGGDDE